MLVKILIAFAFLYSAHSMVVSEGPQRGGRILGGTAKANASIASIQIITIHGNYHICGGFIINKRWLGTAAQCVIGQTNDTIGVSVGVASITSTRVLRISTIEIHPSFNELSLLHDVAVLRTAEEILFTSLVQPIAIETKIYDPSTPVDIYGWGRTAPTSPLYSTLLRGFFTVFDLYTCHENFPFVSRRFITTKHICTQHPNFATCPGDAGGPVIFNNTVVGIASWVEPCIAGRFNVNIRVASYASWIKNITKADDV